MSGYGDGTGWSSERGETPGYSGSMGNSGNKNGHTGQGNKIDPQNSINRSIGEKISRRNGINPNIFYTYTLSIDGEILGITKTSVITGSNPYAVNLGYPRPNDIPNGNSSANAPGGSVPYDVDISASRIIALNKKISDNVPLLNMGQSGRRITNARIETINARAELALILDSQKKQSKATEVQDAIKFTTEFYNIVTDKYGTKASELAKYYALQAKGKRLRNASQSIDAFNRYRGSNIKKFNKSDLNAISNALKSMNYEQLAKNLRLYSKGLGYYGTITDVVDIINEIIKSCKNNNWTPVFVKLETIAAGKVATVAVAFAFSIITSVSLGIIGYAIIMALVSSLINDELIKTLNRRLGIK